MSVYDMLLLLCLLFYLSTIGNSGVFAGLIVKPDNPLNVFKKFVPKRTGILNHPSLSNAVTGAITLASTIRRTTRREVYFHRFKVTDSSPASSLIVNGDKSHRDDKDTHDFNFANVIKSRAQTAYTVFKCDGYNTRVSELRATATQVNGRALTGYPVFLKKYDNPGESEKYYDEEDRPAAVWKTGIDGSLKVEQRNSAEDEDKDDNER